MTWQERLDNWIHLKMHAQQHIFYLKFFLTLGVLCLCAGCGYRLGNDSLLASRYPTVSVPYVVGDADGSLTGAIIQEFTRTGVLRYQRSNGALLLRVWVIDSEDENIGFRYDRKKRGELRHSIIPTETRRTLTAEIAVEDQAAKQIVLGPVRISASVDFDHDFESARDEVNVFSLGQLTDIDAACEAVQTPLNRILARKIVDYVINSW